MPISSDPLKISARHHAKSVFAILEGQKGPNAALTLHRERGKGLLFIQASRMPFFLTDKDQHNRWMRIAEERLLELLMQR